MRTFLFALLFFSALSQGAVVLQYHHVDSTTPAITSTDPEIFRQHLNYIETADLTVVALSEIVRAPEIERDTRIAITFDDAYDNLLDTAIPDLVNRKWPFTIFVATEYVGRKGYLTWQQLQEIEQSGGSIANHTHSHLHMVRLSDSETHDNWIKRLEAEITTAQTKLERHLKQPVKHFAYPYGEYNEDVLTLVDRLGYVGFGQQSGAVGGLSDTRLLPRFPFSGIYANFDTFKVKVHTQAMPASVAFLEPLIADNPPTLTLKFENIDLLRLAQLRCYGPGGETNLSQVSERKFIAVNKKPLPTGRSRYNCTMPIQNSAHYFWLSQLWIKKREDGRWYPE